MSTIRDGVAWTQSLLKNKCTAFLNLPHIGIFLAFLSSVAYSANLILSRIISAGAIQISVFRVSFIYLILIPPFLKRGTQGVSDIVGPKNVTPYLILRGFCGSLAGLFVYLSIKHISPGLAASITFLDVVLVPIFARIMFKESLTPLDIVFALLSFCGVVIIVKPPFLFPTTEENSENFIGVLYACFSALFGTLSYLFVRKIGDQVNSLITTFYFGMVGSVVFIPLLFITGEYELPCLRQIGFLITLCTCSFCSLHLFTLSLHSERPSTIAVIYTSQIVFVLLFQVVLLHDIPSTLSLVGTALIFSSSIGIGIRKIINEKRSEKK